MRWAQTDLTMRKINNQELQRVLVAATITITAMVAWQYLTNKTSRVETHRLADIQIAEQVEVSTQAMIEYNDAREAKRIEAEKVARAKAEAEEKAAEEAARQAEAAQVEEVAVVTPEPVVEPVETSGLDPNYRVDPTAIMDAAGIAAIDRVAVNYIIANESGWRPFVWNSTGSGAYGLCQALPGSKMAVAGADWETNPVTQLRWCSMYAQGKGGWIAAANLWRGQHWW